MVIILTRVSVVEQKVEESIYMYTQVFSCLWQTTYKFCNDKYKETTLIGD